MKASALSLFQGCVRVDLQVLAERLLSCSPRIILKAGCRWRVKAGHQGCFQWRSKEDGAVCMCEQDTWPLRLLLLGGSWGKTPSPGEILCCWAGLNFTTLWSGKWHIILWTRFDFAACWLDVDIQSSLVCPSMVAQTLTAGAGTCAQPTAQPLILAMGLWKHCPVVTLILQHQSGLGVT